MSLENTPKVDFTPADGITDDNLNDIGKNLVSLEDSKYQAGDHVEWQYYHSSTGEEASATYAALSSWVPLVGDSMGVTGIVGGDTSALYPFTPITLHRESSTGLVVYGMRSDTGATVSRQYQPILTVVEEIYIMSNFGAVIRD